MDPQKKDRKPVDELTTDELLDRIFPKEKADFLRKLAHGEDSEEEKPDEQPKTQD